MNSIEYYASRDGINTRKAQRYRERVFVGKWIGGATGVWLVSEWEWQTIKHAIPKKRKNDKMS